MSKKYYKVTSNNMESARNTIIYVDRKRYKCGIQYKIGEWVRPNPIFKNSDIMVFRTLKAARNFASRYERIFECEAKNPKKKGLVIIWKDWKYLFDALKNKRNKKKFLDLSEYESAPIGTVFCSAVKLTKEISTI